MQNRAHKRKDPAENSLASNSSSITAESQQKKLKSPEEDESSDYESKSDSEKPTSKTKSKTAKDTKKKQSSGLTKQKTLRLLAKHIKDSDIEAFKSLLATYVGKQGNKEQRVDNIHALIENESERKINILLEAIRNSEWEAIDTLEKTITTYKINKTKNKKMKAEYTREDTLRYFLYIAFRSKIPFKKVKAFCEHFAIDTQQLVNYDKDISIAEGYLFVSFLNKNDCNIFNDDSYAAYQKLIFLVEKGSTINDELFFYVLEHGCESHGNQTDLIKIVEFIASKEEFKPRLSAILNEYFSISAQKWLSHYLLDPLKKLGAKLEINENLSLRRLLFYGLLEEYQALSQYLKAKKPNYLNDYMGEQNPLLTAFRGQNFYQNEYDLFEYIILNQSSLFLLNQLENNNSIVYNFIDTMCKQTESSHARITTARIHSIVLPLFRTIIEKHSHLSNPETDGQGLKGFAYFIGHFAPFGEMGRQRFGMFKEFILLPEFNLNAKYGGSTILSLFLQECIRSLVEPEAGRKIEIHSYDLAVFFKAAAIKQYDAVISLVNLFLSHELHFSGSVAYNNCILLMESIIDALQGVPCENRDLLTRLIKPLSDYALQTCQKKYPWLHGEIPNNYTKALALTTIEKFGQILAEDEKIEFNKIFKSEFDFLCPVTQSVFSLSLLTTHLAAIKGNRLGPNFPLHEEDLQVLKFLINKLDMANPPEKLILEKCLKELAKYQGELFRLGQPDRFADIERFFLEQDQYREMMITATNAERRNLPNNQRRALRANDAQNVHTAARHQSASLVATKLYTRYIQSLPAAAKTQKLTITNNEISEYLFSEVKKDFDQAYSEEIKSPETRYDFLIPLLVSAKGQYQRSKIWNTENFQAYRFYFRTLEKIYHYRDAPSQIHLGTLVLTVWLAIHDLTLCPYRDVSASLNLFKKTLASLQREYNTVTTEDDRPACKEGAFIRIPYMLNKVHPDVEFKEINRTDLIIDIADFYIERFREIPPSREKNDFAQAVKRSGQLPESFILQHFPDLNHTFAESIELGQIAKEDITANLEEWKERGYVVIGENVPNSRFPFIFAEIANFVGPLVDVAVSERLSPPAEREEKEIGSVSGLVGRNSIFMARPVLVAPPTNENTLQDHIAKGNKKSS